jgi:tRNA pseudouridine55 synthase
MLPVCLGEATKLSQYLLDADKCYRVTGCLGITTDSGDAMGQVIATANPSHCSAEALSAAIRSLQGPIQQIPPMVSALKYRGKPLHAYARAGITIPREPRAVTIYHSELYTFDGCFFEMTVRCSKGTYIRSLVESIGDLLGVGAHVTQLHRLYTAGFEHERAWTLEELAACSEPELMARLLPMDRAVAHLERIILSDTEIQLLRQGQVLHHAGIASHTNPVCLYDQQAQLIGLGELQADHQLVTKRLMAF